VAKARQHDRLRTSGNCKVKPGAAHPNNKTSDHRLSFNGLPPSHSRYQSTRTSLIFHPCGGILGPFDANGSFGARIQSKNVRQLATRGAGATLVSGVVSLGVQMAGTVVLARLLTPRDFGLVTMVTTFSLLLLNFGLNGFTEAIVQREDVSHALASNLFWINVGCSALLALGFASAGTWLARLYKDPHVAGVTEAIAVTIFVTGLQVMPIALLKRAMRFAEASANDVVARGVAIAVSIVFAWLGWGYWALVAGAISLPVSTCLGAWILCRWIPGLPRRAAGTGSAVKFAVNIYARFSTGYFTNNVDNFLVGWRLGSVPLGYYKKAYDLFILSSNQLSTGLTIVAVSALSRLQADAAQYRRYLLSALAVMAFVGMGISGDLALIGKDLILLILGPRWSESGAIFTIFSPGIGMMLLYGTHVWIHLSIGRADRWFRWGLVDLVTTTAALCVGLHWGAKGVAVAWVVAYWLITFPALWYAGRPIQFEIGPVVSAVWRYMLAALAAYLVALFLIGKMQAFAAGPEPLWVAVRILSFSALFVALYFGAVIAFHRSLEPVHLLVGLTREMASRRRVEEQEVEDWEEEEPGKDALARAK
jgi:O-antigen/teichoic acid export membrane protein